MRRYIEALHELPAEFVNQTTDILFLAGGITGCPDWQAEVVAALGDVDDLTILNPRRANFPIDDPTAARAQIEWEARHLTRANIISFWFPKETLCPITLYELGTWTNKAPSLFIGTDPEYARREDIIIQTGLRRGGHTIYDGLDKMIGAMRARMTDPEREL